MLNKSSESGHPCLVLPTLPSFQNPLLGILLILTSEVGKTHLKFACEFLKIQ